ncbi:hypothetical protein [Pararhodospirillum photometricum]|uniref:VWA domain-containing protein n=1 Tax=Pararhodospirillum photometricum DSM 122 TaxID=1150469 RepID=H6SIU0_PARPM|nr:hypothetical protein [Pararhodospirillum photometricum]CCG06717.1 Putative uncharacterized protein [Pararhodospirillum photometricum DSM 122]
MNTLTGLALAPLLPSPLAWSLAGVALAVGLVGLVRRARGAGTRLVALAALVLALLNPQWVTETRSPLPDVALVALDVSPSQTLTGRGPEAEAVAARARQALAPLPGLETRLVRVSEGGPLGTRLMSAVDEALADVPRERRAGVVLVTDGQVHDVHGAPTPGAPVHVVLTGPKGGRDRLLMLAETPRFGLVGKPLPVTVTVEDPALAPGTPVPVSVSHNGAPGDTHLVPANTPTPLSLVLETAGPNVIELSTPVVPGEVAAVNNKIALGINGVRDRLRVLLVSGQPHAGERVWRNLLKADPAVDLVHFTILRPPMKEDLTPLADLALIAFPIRELFEEKLGDFDLIIFDRFVRWGLLPDSYLDNVAAAVEQGGPCCSVSAPSTPSPIVWPPVRWPGSCRPSPPAESRASPFCPPSPPKASAIP